jgi:hypothetical protein
MMSQLPFLLRLVDDKSPNVRAKVAQRLRAYGPNIWDEIRDLNIVLSDEQKALIEDIFKLTRDEVLISAWSSLQGLRSDYLYLENALLALAHWQTGADSIERGQKRLDELAEEFLVTQPYPDSVALSHFLFDFHSLHGAPPNDYHNPMHSNLIYTLENGTGLPITLACVFILVGHRIGLHIEGCNFPGHFLARDSIRDTIFDPYNGGKVLSAREVDLLVRAAPLEMKSAASSREIVARVLRNLSVAYHQKGEPNKSGLFLSLLRSMDGD